jgi:hypothetical protein
MWMFLGFAGSPVPPGVPHNNHSNVNFNLQPPVVVDTHPPGKPFGTVLVGPQAVYSVNQTVNVTFVGANLRNNFMHGSSFMLVERNTNGPAWVPIMTDANWETKFHWLRVGQSESQVVCQWDIPAWMAPGIYRIVHQGYYKPDPLTNTTRPYSGTSPSFSVVAPSHV